MPDTAEQWIIVRNWDHFQHYKDRVPSWIKVYTAELAHNPEYERLTAAQRGLLLTCWIEYALSKGQATMEHVASTLGAGFKHAYFKPLIDAGFIELSASKPLALTRSRELEVLREEKKESAGASERAVDNSSRPRKENNPDAYRRAENMTRNVGWQYEPVDFLSELEKFDLDPGQRHDLEQLRATLLNGAVTEEDW